MRVRFAALALLCGGLCGASCLPLFDTTKRDPVAGNTFSVSIDAPTASRSVPIGTHVEIDWSAANLTGDPAKVRIWLESRVNLHRTELAANLDASDESNSGAVTWDTSDFPPGPYAFIAELRSATKVVTATGDARITVDVPPELIFRSPTDDVTFTAGDTLRIRWAARDLNGSGTARIGLDPDQDHASGNEIFLDEQDLTATRTSAELNFIGLDTENQSVPAGTYLLFAELDDTVNPVSFADAGVFVTVQ
jgi:hypothetical protein